MRAWPSHWFFTHQGVSKHSPTSEEGLTFKNVVSNLDEYYGLGKEDIQSYVFFMHYHLFDHVDILPENINIPDGKVPYDQISNFCAYYEEKIDSYGGLDFGRCGRTGLLVQRTGFKKLLGHLITEFAGRQDNAAFDNIREFQKKPQVGRFCKEAQIIIARSRKSWIVKTVGRYHRRSGPSYKHNDANFVMDNSRWS